MKKSRLYEVNPVEREIIELARQGNPDPFTDYYLRGPNTGTWWLPGAVTPMWKRGYANIERYWRRHGKPDQFEFDSHKYTTVWGHERKAEFPDSPAFHHNHGFKLLPLFKELFAKRYDFTTIVGGWGSGKTMNMGAIFLIWAAIYEDFRGFALGPEAKQANEFVKVAYKIMQGTEYEKRFKLNYTRAPNAYLRIGNSLVGETMIEAYPLLNRADSLLTLTGDAAVIDQAEKFDDLKDANEDVGSRFRGRVMSTGRSRLGSLFNLANSDYNDELWRVFDMATEKPESYRSFQIKSEDNPYLTDADLVRYRNLAGDDPEEQRIKLHGGRPMGNGKEFSRDVLLRMHDSSLDDLMALGLKAEMAGYTCLEARHIGIYEWLLPYMEGHSYLVVSDPGTGNAPDRNAYAILVWDVTHFPGTRENPMPATLAGFIWGSGKGEITNWANKHAELTWKYKAIGRNAFDATGFQAGYDQWMAILNNLMSEKINLSGNNKALCLNAAKMLSASGYIKMPAKITGMYNQLQRYELPEPTNKMKQDLVMAFIMSAWWLQRLFYMTIPIETTSVKVSTYAEDRYFREVEARETVFEDY